MSEHKKYRLVTRSDFDGLVCAVLLKELDMLEDIKFVHPKDMQDGKIEITGNDITTNLPYVEGAHLAFDHHFSETVRVGSHSNLIIDPRAPSAARVVYNYFGGLARFPNVSEEMMEAVDRADSAHFRKSDILSPKDWVLLNFIMDARTGLGRFRDFRVPNYQLMMDLIDYCRTHSIDEILELPDVKERVNLYFEQENLFIDQLDRCSKMYRNVCVVDLRKEETIWAGNRFMVYALHPSCNVSIHVLWGLKKQNTVLACGKSIINRSSRANVGTLMLKYGGGGHEAAGTCQVEHDKADEVLAEIVAQFQADNPMPDTYMEPPNA